MTYYLLLVGDLVVARLAAALAALASVAVEAVDVALVDTAERAWDAPVLCTYEAVHGDVSWSLDVYLSDAVSSAPDEAAAAAFLAVTLGLPVLYSAQPFPPSAYWLAAPDGLRTRARVYDDDQDDTTALVIDAVAAPVASLPGMRVAALPEVIRQHRVPTPVTDEFRAWLAAQMMIPSRGAALWSACDRLAAWETLAVRMASGWPPDGWYPAEYYRDDLPVRDELAADVDRVPPVVAGHFGEALARVDELFRAGTREEPTGPARRGWWWGRVPEPIPWPSGS
jgi:hypothetical protein